MKNILFDRYQMKNGQLSKTTNIKRLITNNEITGGSLLNRDNMNVNPNLIQVNLGQSMNQDYTLPTGKAGRRSKNKFNF